MVADISQNNKRIAKNTIALYFRTFITLLVGLYTGRVMLQALGVENYGINALVGGIVGMSALITNTMSGAISRYITFAIGKGDKDMLKKMFSTAINAQIILALLVTFILEIGGVWFLNNGANIPSGREIAANWVLQCSIITLFISLISSPFTATIIAHEKMAIYAYTSIVEAVLKLLICFLIITFDGDRLIFFALLQIAVAILMQSIYAWYCGTYFEEFHYHMKTFDKRLMKELTIFSGWNLVSNGSYVFSTQGINMLVNVFFGVVFNASRSIAMTVNNAIQGFVNNFTMAFTPQIIKNYAVGNKDYAISLANRGTKFTWLMMYLFIVPVCVEADTLLSLWLGEVPEMAPLFLRFAMFESLAQATGQNLYRLIQADGRVKHYVVHAALAVGLVFPLSFLAFRLDAPVWSAYLIFIIVFLILNIIRFYDLKKLMNFSIKNHLKECVYPSIVVSITSFIVPILLTFYLKEGILRLFVNGFVSIIWTWLCCFLFGLTKTERQFFLAKIQTVIRRNG